jgi:hypothetical protein
MICGNDNSSIKNDTCPRDADLRNGSHQERERTHLQNNKKAKAEQLKLSKTNT